MNKLTDHQDYKNWNPLKARASCFQQILPLVRDLLTGGNSERKESTTGTSATANSVLAANDRLLQLIIKGVISSTKRKKRLMNYYTQVYCMRAV